MTGDDMHEVLVNYLKDAHSIEQQALQQLRAAPKIAGETGLATALQDHLVETEGQERLIRERLEAHGSKPSVLKDVVMRAGGAGFVLFAASQPDTPGKLNAHAYSYEHLELAAYELLDRIAQRAGDDETSRLHARSGPKKERWDSALLPSSITPCRPRSWGRMPRRCCRTTLPMPTPSKHRQSSC
jgi:ferritin-like metal-binding protein YciE